MTKKVNSCFICWLSILISIVAISCSSAVPKTDKVTSPNGKYSISFSCENESNTAKYSVIYNDKEIVSPSKLGFLLDGSKEIGHGLSIKMIEKKEIKQSWKPVYGERNEYPENYNESRIFLQEKETKKDVMIVNLRAYDEGIAFRYEFFDDNSICIKEELTQFALQASAKVWATEMSQGVISKVSVSDLSDRTERPLLVQYSESEYLAIGEAAQIDYARMKLVSTDVDGVLEVSLGSEVNEKGAFTTPWRFIMAGRNAGEILENNYLILNLNEPCEIQDKSWLKPGKVIRDLTLTTSGGKAFIDFAAKHGIDYVIESAGWYGDEFTTDADAATVTVDPKRSTGPLDMKEVIRYGEGKGVGIMVYVNRNQMEKQLDEILPLYEEWGLKGIKYGFVRTGDQEWSSWMHEAVRKAAKHKMVLSIHDDYRPVGYSRTYPNLMTQEGIRGDEETPSNVQTINTMFTRMIAGAGDNTICYFAPRVETMGSHASQLAKSVCLYSPLLWLYWYDRPAEAGFKSGGAGGTETVIEELPELAFFDDVPTVWDETKVIHSDLGILGTIARRKGESWFVGSINGNVDRELTIPLNFLEKGKDYTAIVYYDDENVKSTTRVGVETLQVNRKTKIVRDIFKNNGVAIKIYPNS